MSSYTIAKEEYIKAAGLVAGIAEGLDMWIYDYEKGRNSLPEDYKRRFAECYTMNSISVKEQYHGEEVGALSGDTEDYEKAFNSFFKKGKALCIAGGMPLSHAMMELSTFFRSAVYQTEKEPYMFKMEMFFDRIICNMFEKISKKADMSRSHGEG